MNKTVLRHIRFFCITFFGITLITFILFNVAGGDPSLYMAGKHTDTEQLHQLRQQLGLDQPYHSQYISHLRQILSLDFGRSWATQQKVSHLIFKGIVPTLCLTLPSLFISLFLSLTLGLLAASKPNSKKDLSIVFVCLILLSFSSLVYIIGLQYQLAFKNHWFPVSGWNPSWSGRWPYLALPIITYTLLSLGHYVLFYRTVFIYEMQKNYIRTARAKGLSTFIILNKHLLKNSLVPIITLVIHQIPFLILGSLVIESFFSIPGLGGIMFQAIQGSDFPVIKAITILSATLYLLLQILVDVLYTYIDPQMKVN